MVLNKGLALFSQDGLTPVDLANAHGAIAVAEYLTKMDSKAQATKLTVFLTRISDQTCRVNSPRPFSPILGLTVLGV